MQEGAAAPGSCNGPAWSPRTATVLDLAAGRGRHALFFAERGHRVTAVDRDISRLPDHPNIEPLQADLEDGSPWPLGTRRFGAVVVTNYLHRPLMPALLSARSSRAACCSTRPSWKATSASADRADPDLPAARRRAARAGARRLLGHRLRGAPMVSEPRDGDGAADRGACDCGRSYSAALATRLVQHRRAHFRSCCSDGTILRASSTLARSMSAITKPAVSPPASASTSPHGATATEWP